MFIYNVLDECFVVLMNLPITSHLIHAILLLISVNDRLVHSTVFCTIKQSDRVFRAGRAKHGRPTLRNSTRLSSSKRRSRFFAAK